MNLGTGMETGRRPAVVFKLLASLVQQLQDAVQQLQDAVQQLQGAAPHGHHVHPYLGRHLAALLPVWLHALHVPALHDHLPHPHPAAVQQV
eukprot:122171-Pelagomonas_calceolata.AAC.4